jgi:hypothetical protein
MAVVVAHGSKKYIAVLFCCINASMTAAALPDNITMTCTVSDKIFHAQSSIVCLEIVTALERVYPGSRFQLNPAEHRPALNVIIHNASATGLDLQLVWHTAAGDRIEGQRMSVSAMDRKLGSSQRQSLYHRIITATPMPKQ